MRSKWLNIPLLVLVGCLVWAGQAGAFNYAEALQKSLYFYDAEKSGPGITGGRLTWRGDSELVDMAVPLNEAMTNMSQAFINANRDVLDPDGNGSVDVSGGYHDAGDHVKFGLPQSYSSSTLEWALYEFKDAFVRIGEYDHMVELLRWFSDYYLRSTFRNSAGEVVAFCYQVGEGSIDHNFWGPPELIDHQLYPRPAYFATAEAPASDQAAGAAASLALTYLNSKEDDPAYAQRCLDTAIALYAFAVKYRGLGYSGGFYGSGFDHDELSWAAVWLNIATGEASYIEDIIRQDDQGFYTGWLSRIIRSSQDDWQNIWVHCWDTKWGGVFAKLAPITDNPRDWEIFRWNLEYWSGVPHQNTGDGAYLAKTPDGFSYLSTWGSARYNAAAQFQGMVYKKYTGSTIFDSWMTDQINYIMGDNPLGRSYIVGYGDDCARHPHHRAAHGSSTNSMFDPPEHKHTLWGALVGGPGPDDEHVDETRDFIYNEVAIDYNAGLVGALAGQVFYFGQDHQPLADFPPADPPLVEHKVEAKIEQASNQRSQLSIRVTNESAFPPRREIDIMARYFFDISELAAHGQGISAISFETYYDQNAVNGDPVTAVGPLAWDAANGIYYIELRWPESGFYGTREYQFGLIAAMAGDYSSHWDPSNDFSYQGLGGEYIETPYVPLYVNGELYSGGCPGDGSGPTPTPTPVADIPVTGVSLVPASVTLSVDETAALTAAVKPANATTPSVQWTSSNTAVAVVSAAGIVTARSAGEAVITVTTRDGGFSDTCTVTVEGNSSGGCDGGAATGGCNG